MIDELKILVKMQKIDDEIGEKEKKKKELPKQLKSLKENVENANYEVQKLKEELDENLKTQKKKELEIQENKGKIDKYKNQLLTIKTNKEYKALNSEINFLGNKNNEIDDVRVELMEEEEQLREDKTVADKEKIRADAELEAKEKKLEAQIEEVTKNIEELRSQRNELAKNLPRQLIKRYGALIKNKGRKAVVFNENNACGGCGFKIRPQLQIDINEGNRIISCENCGRIIVSQNAKED
ncbi:MAG: C4-type zinc ribbon domain-containing protein [Candidatus Cloacimonadota bacterium]|nr:C4-type zinc ribbon domain-containing protein [Candidatus Cloacimonadota bacterium]